MIVAGMVFGFSMMGGMDPTLDPEAAAAAAMSGMTPIIIISLLFLYPALAVYTKRWHDRGKSGWWTLILLVPLIGFIWFLVECGFLRGTEGPNGTATTSLTDFPSLVNTASGQSAGRIYRYAGLQNTPPIPFPTCKTLSAAAPSPP